MNEIQIVMSGMCKGCKIADLELVDLDVTDFNGEECTEWYIKCNNERACRKWTEKNNILKGGK